MRITGIHHVAIIASDYERAKRFYVDVLGFRILQETYREARRSYKLDLELPDRTQIELFSFPDSPKRLSYPEACGLRHLALSVTSLDAALEELKAKGIVAEPVRVDPITGQRFTFFADPDGLPIEFYESKA